MAMERSSERSVLSDRQERATYASRSGTLRGEHPHDPVLLVQQKDLSLGARGDPKVHSARRLTTPSLACASTRVSCR